jgi:hypothetical protein
MSLKSEVSAMETDTSEPCTGDWCEWKGKMKEHMHCHGCGGGIMYGLGFIAALVYYLQTATSFWDGVLGFFEALFWPAFLVYGVLKFIGA